LIEVLTLLGFRIYFE